MFKTSKDWIAENPRLTSAVGLTAAISLSLISYVYYRLYRCDRLPFDSWHVSLGWIRPQIAEPQNLADLITKYSPEHLAASLYGYLLATKKTDSLPEDPTTPKEWMEWLSGHFDQREKLLPKVDQIFPVYNEKDLPSVEDAKTLRIQTWATSLQQWVAFLGWNTLMMTESVFQAIRSSPRLAYTILFHVTAPFVAQKIWENIQDPLPESLVRVKGFYLNHRRAVALASLGLVALLFYRMKQEKGILKNLTQAWASFQRGHKRFDLIPSYKQGIHQVFTAIGKSLPGKQGSNILWFYQKQAHRTFGEEIGEVLAEETAAGRIYSSDRKATDFPHLSSLQVCQLDLEEFLTEHRDVDSVYAGWNETMKHISDAGNVIVVLKGLSVIAPRMFPEYGSSQRDEGRIDRQRDTSQILASLVTLSLQQGKFRCLLVLDEQEKERFKQEFTSLFTQIRAPDLKTEEQKEVCARLYTDPGIARALPRSDVESLFKLMKPTLDFTPLPPSDIMYAIQDAHRTWELRWRHAEGNRELNKKIEDAENNLQEVQLMKEKLLEKLWEKQEIQEQPLALLQAILMLEKVLLPLYMETVKDLKKSLPSAKQVLVNTAQKRFSRFFGPCLEDEETRLLTLPKLLSQHIKGQEPAINAIGKAVYRWRKVPPLDRKPLVLFFAGPPASGKTQTSTQLAHHLNYVYGISESAEQSQEKNTYRINLNRKNQGAFLGWDIIKVQILEFIHKTPTCVIVFEEWDKMEDEEKGYLLDILEGTQSYIEGVYSGYRERPFVEKRCATFIIIANTAADELSKPVSGDEKQQFIDDTAMVQQRIVDSFPERKKKDAQAFFSRIGQVIPFRGISQQAGKDLIDIYLDKYVDQGVLPHCQRDQVRKNIPPDIHDGRKLQDAVEEAIFKVATADNI
ncbi:MAG: hypothetical protein JSS10_08390 [Verrucomicrobia bacterium]|nr:hypothetical protein [Verrucomicrobiota bacterium]